MHTGKRNTRDLAGLNIREQERAHCGDPKPEMRYLLSNNYPDHTVCKELYFCCEKTP
jgi:hypothetical protein